MLKKAADKFKSEGISKVLINWNLEPDDKNFFVPVKETEIIVLKETHEFLKAFYYKHVNKITS